MPLTLEHIKEYTRPFPVTHRFISVMWQFFICHIIPDKIYLRVLYKKRLRRRLNLSSPVLFSEKIQWMKLYWRDPLATKCADKYAVRAYVKDKVGDSILNDLYGV